MRFPSGVKQHRPRPAKTLLASAGLAVASTQQKTKICVQMRVARNPRPGRIPRLGQNKAIHLASLGNAPEKNVLVGVFGSSYSKQIIRCGAVRESC